MISYSDFILSQKPWGYWPLSDQSLTQYDEFHYLIDCSGNKRNLKTEKTGITYEVGINPSLHDLLPLKGITVSGSPILSGFPGESKVYYPGGQR